LSNFVGLSDLLGVLGIFSSLNRASMDVRIPAC
jgi:hypothetical protein